MWQEAQSNVAHHLNFIGLSGDSIAFIGSLFLSGEALFKNMERISVESRRKIIASSPFAETSTGQRLDDKAVEEKWQRLWAGASMIGTVLLAIGFAFLIVGRLRE